MQEVEGVEDVHDLHVWSLGAQTHALSSHVTIADIPPSESARILDEINGVLLRSFHIHHTTIQFEHVGCPVAHGCVMPVEEVAAHQHHH
jgi:cobalt-zinc-cadmium efflux system protein